MGLSKGVHRIGELEINITDSCAYILGTNTLCGSILPLNQCVKLFDEYNGEYIFLHWLIKVSLYVLRFWNLLSRNERISSANLVTKKPCTWISIGSSFSKNAVLDLISSKFTYRTWIRKCYKSVEWCPSKGSAQLRQLQLYRPFIGTPFYWFNIFSKNFRMHVFFVNFDDIQLNYA